MSDEPHDSSAPQEAVPAEQSFATAETQNAAPAAAETSPAEQQAPTLAAEDSDATIQSDAPTRESVRIPIGSQRPRAANPVKPIPILAPKPVVVERPEGLPPREHVPAPAKKYPPPNTRDKLTPDMEVEFAEALGGVSLDAMLAGGVGAAADLEPEARVSGRVVSVHREDVFVDLGAGRQGVLSLGVFTTPPEIGQSFDLVVARFNAVDGLYELTLPGGAVEVADWSSVNEGMIVEATITGHNKGGLECAINRIRGFIPASQMSLYRVEDMSQFVGQKMVCVITEANPTKGNLVLSRRAMLEREKAEAKAQIMTELEVGQVREATVRSLQDFGAFVDLGGVDGLIHISQLSWDRIKHASEVLEVGQKVKVKIQKIDSATGKIGLAFRDLAENPWGNAAHKFPARSKVKGTVSRIMEFGAFVRLEAGVEGLIHISELSHKRVWRASDILQEGQEVEVQVLSVDADKQRMSLSLKALEARSVTVKPEDQEPDEEEVAPAANPQPQRKTPLKGGIGGGRGGEAFGLKW